MASQLSFLPPILVVEDDQDLRDSLCMLLHMEGFHAVGVRHGAEALQYLEHSPPPRLILLDLMMPGMTGSEFRRYQRTTPSLAQVPVVVLSAMDESVQREAVEGAAHYLTKPVSFEELVRAVRACCTALPVSH